ncbi:hypothetical protein EV383_3076 [Pseudonocardia sediminis]|uniref:CAAX prenyl protease 2/Lysostaphin resistance protein A-like domain-containing protein n=1 Tax=Pseudonocardia sediminis TaxID=1397368 RepID=A0A4Q7UWG4_PSEST|nr:type II CAAX endopeptidase family protein [Pseudonocardia sediminis]RZT86186.1 hypothetical protein EV383_3076 [Pseudonocardia sediminis]
MTEQTDRPSGDRLVPDGGAGSGVDGAGTGQGPGIGDAAAPGPVRPGTGRPGRPSIGWTEIGVGVVAYLVLSVAAALAIGAGTPGAQPAAFPLLVATGMATLLAALVALAVRVRWLPAIGLCRTTVRWLLIGVGAGVVARVISIGAVFGYLALTGDTDNPQAMLGEAAAGTTLELLGLMLGGAVLVPIAEELLFRGIGYSGLRRYGVWVALIVSSLVFGLAHGINVVLPAAVCLGAINAFLYERSGSIWPSVLSHGVHNALGFGMAALMLG